MKKVIFFDVDNTLVCRENNHICESTIRALKMCKNNGVGVAIATGRSLAMLKQEGLHELAEMIISSNGSMVTVGEEVVYQQPMPKETIKLLIEALREKDIPYVIHLKDSSKGMIENEWIQELAEKYNMRFEDLDEEQFEGVYQLNAKISQEYLEQLKEQFERLRFVPLIDLAEGYDIFGSMCNKGSGIQQIKNLFKENNYKYYCFGDGFNDFEMFEAVDYAIAMGNGCEELKAKADYVTDKISQQGVYKALKNLGII